MSKLATLILAAGKGKRMKSSLPKVLHKAMGLTVLEHVMAATTPKSDEVICVLSPHNEEQVSQHLGSEVKVCLQKEQKGTGHAVLSAIPLLKKMKIDEVLITPGDMPLLERKNITKLIQRHRKGKKDITLLTGVLDQPKGYGRILRDGKGGLCRIVEEKDLQAEEKEIQEVNTGVYLVNLKTLQSLLPKVKSNNAQKEFYLTDIIELASKDSKKRYSLGSLSVEGNTQSMGVNSRRDLAKVTEVLKERKVNELMDKGVTIEDPHSTFIDSQVTIGQDTVIHPFTIITGKVKIGKNCEIGPFAHIREDVTLESKACIGNFVEVKKSHLGSGTKAKHLTYLGNAKIGKKVNFGAGTVTANYDGFKKHPTFIEDGCKIGSNTVIVAPNHLKKEVTTGAGTVIPANRKTSPGALLKGVPAQVSKSNLTDRKK